MKKIIIPVIAFAMVSIFTISCGSDASSLDGIWTTTSADFQSSKYDDNTSLIIEEEYAKTNIKFGPDDKVQVARGTTTQVGAYSLDEATNTLKMGAPEGDPNFWKEDYVILNKSSNEMTLVQKVDDEGTTATIVIQRKQ